MNIEEIYEIEEDRGKIKIKQPIHTSIASFNPIIVVLREDKLLCLIEMIYPALNNDNSNGDRIKLL